MEAYRNHSTNHLQRGVHQRKSPWSSHSGRTMHNGWPNIVLQTSRSSNGHQEVEEGAGRARHPEVRPGEVMPLRDGLVCSGLQRKSWTQEMALCKKDHMTQLGKTEESSTMYMYFAICRIIFLQESPSSACEILSTSNGYYESKSTSRHDIHSAFRGKKRIWFENCIYGNSIKTFCETFSKKCSQFDRRNENFQKNTHGSWRIMKNRCHGINR